MSTKYTVNLSELEIRELQKITTKGKTAVRKLKRAQILLLAKEGYSDDKIAQVLKVSESTVHRTRQKCVELGLESALTERPRRGRRSKLNGKAEAFLVATACSEAPLGRKSWTMQLLADRLVEMNLVEDISDETVRLKLKKTKLNLGLKNNGVLLK
jgi:transposase